MKSLACIHNLRALDTMVPVRDFLRLVLLANFIQSGCNAPMVTPRRRREIGTRQDRQQRRPRAMSRASLSQYDWGELPMVAQGRESSGSASLVLAKSAKIPDAARENE